MEAYGTKLRQSNTSKLFFVRCDEGSYPQTTERGASLVHPTSAPVPCKILTPLCIHHSTLRGYHSSKKFQVFSFEIVTSISFEIETARDKFLS